MKTYNVIDLFCGCGGSAVGLDSLHRTNTVLAVDFWDKATKEYKHNLKVENVLCRDLTKFTEDELKSIVKDTKIDIVMGGPPCQGFTLLKRLEYKNGKNENMEHKNHLFQEFLRVVDYVKPKVVIMENVLGILSMKNKHGEKVLDNILKAYEQIGYHVKYQVVKCYELGLPQTRERVIFFASNDKEIFDDLEYPKSKGYRTTIGDAIEDLGGSVDKDGNISNEYSKNTNLSDYAKQMRDINTTKVDNHYTIQHRPSTIERMKLIKQGENVNSIPKDSPYSVKSRFSCTYSRKSFDVPMNTITNVVKSLFIHPTENRVYSIRETLRLQGFPDSYVFIGDSRNAMYQMIANSISPIMMKEIGINVIKTLDKFNS